MSEALRQSHMADASLHVPLNRRLFAMGAGKTAGVLGRHALSAEGRVLHPPLFHEKEGMNGSKCKKKFFPALPEAALEAAEQASSPS
jgi:hypothetical protein